MENTPTGCAVDLPTILGIYKNESKSRSVNISFQRLIFDPNSTKVVFTSQSSAQLLVLPVLHVSSGLMCQFVRRLLMGTLVECSIYLGTK